MAQPPAEPASVSPEVAVPGLGSPVCFCLFGASTSKDTSGADAESPENALLRELFIAGS